ncbi:MAG: hemolysin III family protein [Gemmatimonadaceae bacterium]
MRRISLREPVNGLTHLAGAVLSVVGLVVLLVIAIGNGSARQVVAFSIFGASLVSMYCASAFYHSLKVSERAVAHLRRIDHMMIYILIAGSYTPICLVMLRGPLGLGLLIAVWSLAALGTLQTVAWMHAPQWLSTALYIGMGWIAVFIVRPLLAAAPSGFFLWLLGGGVIYTLGAIVHATDWPRVKVGSTQPLFGSHEIWHLFVMGGSFAHYWAMLAYVSKTA